MRIHANGILSRFALHAQGPCDRGTPARRSGASANRIYLPGPRITCVDQAVIHEYFRDCAGAACAGAANGDLHELRLRELPAALEQRLSKLPPGFERAWKGRDLLLIETQSGRVIDIMREARLAH